MTIRDTSLLFGAPCIDCIYGNGHGGVICVAKISFR